MRQTNNKLGKGAANISAKTCFSASHSVAPTPFSSPGISVTFFFLFFQTTMRQNPEINLPIMYYLYALTSNYKHAADYYGVSILYVVSLNSQFSVQ